MRARPFLALFTVAAAAGFLFASFSTYDFVQHLDRQVHGIHCSFIPGLAGTDVSGTTGCHTTLMSPYSSVFRKAIWGGIPVSLPAMGVFAYMLYRGLDALVNRRASDRGLAGFLVAAAALPFLTSLVMGYISLVELDAACKLCIGIYASSALLLVGALGFWAKAGPETPPYDPHARPSMDEPADDDSPQSGMGDHAVAFGQGVAFVGVPLLLYVGTVPDFSSYTGTCGTLPKPEDPYGVMVAMDQNPSGKSAIEVLDPLCPSCRAFENRLHASGLDEKMNRKAVLFPLDSTCNWMVQNSLHPGACSVSEAVLCAGDRAPAVLDWAFENQEQIRAASETDPAAAAYMVTAAFPDLKSCVGSSKARSRLNKSLRWAVANQLRVMTPQLYVDGQKLCDEDTDIGMDYALSRLLDYQGGAAPAVRQGGM